MIKKTVAKKDKSTSVFQESQVMALLERMEDSIKLVAENQVATNEKVDNLSNDLNDFKERVEYRFLQIDGRFSQIDDRFSQIDDRFSQMEKKFDQNFSLVMNCLSNIEDETIEIKVEIKKLAETKVDKHQWELLLEKVNKMEQELERQKNIIKTLQLTGV